MNRIIAACNQKGGVGKTTTCVNLSAALAAMEKKTLLVDMDPQANSTQGFGFDVPFEADIYDAMLLPESEINETRIQKLIQKTSMPFLDLFPCSRSLAGLEVQLIREEKRDQRLRWILNSIKKNYAYILIDSPPSLNILTLNVLSASDSVLIPIQCEYYALQGLAELLNTIRIVQQSTNPNLAIEGALLTMYDSRLNLSKQVAEDVTNTFSEKVFKTIIPRNVKLSEAPSFGKPVILYDAISSGAVRYLELAKEIVEND